MLLSQNALPSKNSQKAGQALKKLVLRTSLFPFCSDCWVIQGFNPNEPLLLMRLGQSIGVWPFLQGMLNVPLFWRLL